MNTDLTIDRGIGGLDPFALLAALAFGAFLLQLLLTLLNTSQRSLDVVDINVPLMMSDYHIPNIMTRMDVSDKNEGKKFYDAAIYETRCHS